MKYLKMLGLAAIAAAALMAFVGAGTASATNLCETTPAVGQPCPAGWHWNNNAAVEFSLSPGATAALSTTAGAAGTTCSESTVKGNSTTPANPATETVIGHISLIEFKKCTNPTSTLTNCTLEIHNIAGTHNGTVTGLAGCLVTVVTFGFHCAYGTGTGIDLGEFTPGKGGLDGELHVNTVVQRATSHNGSNFSIFCPATAKWNATYTQTTNTPLYITAA